MLTEPTIERLKTLRLDAMAAAWAAQRGDASMNKLSFDERLGLLVRRPGHQPIDRPQGRGRRLVALVQA